MLLGCPKFDDVEEYLSRFKEIFSRGDIKSITVLTMEVPCCSGLPTIVERAMDSVTKKIPMEKIVLSTRGEVIKQEKIAA